MCYNLTTGVNFIQLTYYGDTSFWLQFFGLFLAIINLWFAFLIHTNKELQAHPMNLFKWIAIAYAIFFSN